MHVKARQRMRRNCFIAQMMYTAMSLQADARLRLCHSTSATITIRYSTTHIQATPLNSHIYMAVVRAAGSKLSSVGKNPPLRLNPGPCVEVSTTSISSFF